MKINIFKKIAFSSFLFSFFFFLITSAHAATPTPAPSGNQVPQEEADLERIQRIKELVASKVAELNLVEKKGIIGTVREITGMKIVVMDLKGSSRQIDVDELTKFGISKTSNGISDLTKGTMYSFVGLYNKETKRLLARNVGNVSAVPAHFEGAITSVDSKNFQISIVNEKGEKKNVDIESSTKTSLANANGDLLKSGFSKLEPNTRILAIGFWDRNDKNLLAAVRIIHFEDVPPSKEMQSHVSLNPDSDSEAN